MTATTHRHIAMILAVPVRKTGNNSRVSTKEVYDVLREKGYDVALRTVQRDLHDVGKYYGVQSGGTTSGLWWWRNCTMEDA